MPPRALPLLRCLASHALLAVQQRPHANQAEDKRRTPWAAGVRHPEDNLPRSDVATRDTGGRSGRSATEARNVMLRSEMPSSHGHVTAYNGEDATRHRPVRHVYGGVLGVPELLDLACAQAEPTVVRQPPTPP